jgi:hypothetical protein
MPDVGFHLYPIPPFLGIKALLLLCISVVSCLRKVGAQLGFANILDAMVI